jgi:hypothetical protein
MILTPAQILTFFAYVVAAVVVWIVLSDYKRDEP